MRQGAEFDGVNLCELFEALFFTTELKSNLTAHVSTPTSASSANLLFPQEQNGAFAVFVQCLTCCTLLWRISVLCFGQEMKKALLQEVQRPEHKEAEAFVLCVMSHGARGVVYGVDGEQLEIDKHIIQMFKGSLCPNLLNKPKVIIIQACQGSKSSLHSGDLCRRQSDFKM